MKYIEHLNLVAWMGARRNFCRGGGQAAKRLPTKYKKGPHIGIRRKGNKKAPTWKKGVKKVAKKHPIRRKSTKKP